MGKHRNSLKYLESVIVSETVKQFKIFGIRNCIFPLEVFFFFSPD